MTSAISLALHQHSKSWHSGLQHHRAENPDCGKKFLKNFCASWPTAMWASPWRKQPVCVLPTQLFSPASPHTTTGGPARLKHSIVIPIIALFQMAYVLVSWFMSVLSLCLSAAINTALIKSLWMVHQQLMKAHLINRLLGVKLFFLDGLRRLKGVNATTFIIVFSPCETSQHPQCHNDISVLPADFWILGKNDR